MGFVPPNKIHITSDDTIIEYVKTLPKSNTRKVEGYLYKYIQSPLKLGSEVEMSESYIVQQLANYFKII